MTAFSNTIISPKVPVIAVFTKYDQFLRNVKIHLEDYGNPGDIVSAVAEKQFQEHYLQPLGDSVSYVQLESEFRVNSRCYYVLNILWQRCTDISITANSSSRRQQYHWMMILSP